jgi:hypothetical protein
MNGSFLVERSQLEMSAAEGRKKRKKIKSFICQ